MKAVSGAAKWRRGYLGSEPTARGNVAGDVFGAFHVVVCGVSSKSNVVLIHRLHYSSRFTLVSVAVMSRGMFKEIGGFAD